MTAIFFAALVLTLLYLLGRWIASAPLVRAFSIMIDNWADDVQGSERFG